MLLAGCAFSKRGYECMMTGRNTFVCRLRIFEANLWVEEDRSRTEASAHILPAPEVFVAVYMYILLNISCC